MEHLLNLKYERGGEKYAGVTLRSELVPFTEDMINKLVAKCEVKALERALIQIDVESWKKLIANGNLDACESVLALRTRLVNVRKTSIHMWISVNPWYNEDDNSEWKMIAEKLFKQTKKYCNKVNIKNAMWCLEQTGVDAETSGKHPHAHMVVEFKELQKPFNFKKELENCFKKIIDKPTDTNLNWRPCKPDHVDRRASYMLKRKCDTPDVVQNIKWRKTMKFDPCFFRGDEAKKWAKISDSKGESSDESESEE